MKRRNHGPHDKADQLDNALDAMMRGDHSGLDELPPEMAATVDRLMWLSHGVEDQQGQGIDFRAAQPEIGGRDGPRTVSVTGVSRPSTAPVSRRTSRASGLLQEEATPASPEKPRQRPRSMPAILRVAAILLVVVLAGGAVYGLIPLLDDSGSQYGGRGIPNAGELEILQLQPERCLVEPMEREGALQQLRQVDADADEALRRSMRFAEAEPGLAPELVKDLNDHFVMWQSCRRFGFTYEAMSLQSPYFLREEFYGETALDFRGPIETAYSDATLNEMLDRREELDATSRRYWETAGHYPSPAETLQLGGESFISPDGSYVAVRAVHYDTQESLWKETTTVVVYQVAYGDYLLFDVLTVPPGEIPYLIGHARPPA